jgi:hypothetical protein
MTSILDQILAAFHDNRDILELDGQNLAELPPQIGMLTELQVLSLSGNQLTRLPEEIGNLSKLVELALDENCLTELNPTIGRLTSLESLWLAHNKLRALPASIGCLASLKTLKLDHNQLRSLPPEIGKLTKLRRLNIEYNQLSELPAEFAELDRLQDFDWAKWEARPKKGLPPRNVRNFIAHGNPWSHPPAEIMKQTVDVIRNYLKANPTHSQTAPYTVCVDDNYHHGEESYRYKAGTYTDCESAIAACRKIVDEFLAARGDDQKQDLFDSYRQFGEDPFIVTSDKNCVFSAWNYARQRCQELADAATKADPSSLDNPLLNGNGMNMGRWASPPPPDREPGAVPGWTPPACPAPPPLPSIVSADPIPIPGAPYGYSFQSVLDVPPTTEPHREARLRKEFPECKWQEQREDRNIVRMEGISQNSPRGHLNIGMVRRESFEDHAQDGHGIKRPALCASGPFNVTVAIEAQNQSEAEKAHHEVMRRITWALIGWSPTPLPHFKARSASNIEREEIVPLPPLLEGPHIIISDFQTDILISRTLVEGFSLHREVLAPWAADDLENRAALLRGEAARVILRQSVSTDSSQNLQATLVLVRPAFRLIGELLELGLAQVVQYDGPGGRAPGGLSTLLARIQVHYAGSYASFSAVDGKPFLQRIERGF